MNDKCKNLSHFDCGLCHRVAINKICSIVVSQTLSKYLSNFNLCLVIFSPLVKISSLPSAYFTGSAICFCHYSFSLVQLSDNVGPNFIPDSSRWVYRLSFEVSFITEFHSKGCQNSQKEKNGPMAVCIQANISAKH